MNYSDLSEETQLFLNKAMDIYAIIKDKSLKRVVQDIIKNRKNYEFTLLDKKVLALFIAGLLVEGNLKEIFSQYDDIKLDDLFDYIGISENDITPIEDEKYEEFFNKNIKLDLVNILTQKNTFDIINFVTPEVIVSSLAFSHVSSSKILDFYHREHQLSGLEMYEHPLFRALDNYTHMDGSISDRPLKGGGGVSEFAPAPTTKSNPNSLINTKKKDAVKLDDNVWQILEEIKKKFIGQETAAEGLFYNIILNQKLAEKKDVPDGRRSIIFVDGPTGTGKTAIIREITEKLGVPFQASSVTNYSSTGYVGGDLTDLLEALYKNANGDLEKAQRGIIVLDELDKIAYSEESGELKMKRAVQQQLLDFLGGGKYTIHVGNIFDRKSIEFDTSKLTFVCLASLTNLRSEKEEINETKTIGFGQTSQIPEERAYSITPEDIMGIGLEQELVGRFNTYLHTDGYSKEALEKILRESEISPLVGFRELVEESGKKLIIDDNVYGLIAEQAYLLNTGARSLQAIVNIIRTLFLKEILRGSSKEMHLDAEVVRKACSQATNRKGRG